MSQESESLLTHRQRRRLSGSALLLWGAGGSHGCERAAEPGLLMAELKAKSVAQHLRNLRMRTLWTHFPDNRGQNQIEPEMVRRD